MKYIATLVLALSIISCCPKQESISSNEEKDVLSTIDTNLAKKLGADDYGMRKYVIAFLKRGENKEQDSAKARELQRAHLDNINKMAEDGILVLAGPFLDKGDLRGIYVFALESIEEAERYTNSDPAIKSGHLEMELHPWYGSAAVMQINDIHNKIAVKNP